MLTSPRRIAVVVLAAAIGWALQTFGGFEHAILRAVILGLVAAMFVPARGACTVTPPPRG